MKAGSRQTWLLFIAAVLALGVWALPDTARQFNLKGIARQVLEQHIRPGYAKLAEAAQEFKAAAHMFCAGTPGQPIEPLKDAFGNLVLAWSRIGHIRFGPVMTKRRHARMHYWPDRKGIGRRQVLKALGRNDASVLNADNLAEKSVALQGLGTLEVLLFGRNANVLENPGPARQFRCNYVLAVATNLASISRDLRSSWQDGQPFPVIFLTPGATNPSYLDETEVILETANAFLTGIERLRDVKIAGPTGLRPTAAARVRAAFERSGLSTQAVLAELEGLISFYTDGGFFERIEAYEPGAGNLVLDELNQALDRLQKVNIPMAEAAAEDEMRDRLIEADSALKTARIETWRVLTDAAKLSLGFNALDGD